MDLKQLHYFVTVAREGSISAAARRLYLSQPPLSAQMKALEAELGCTLFERGTRSIQLTQAGRLLFDRASALLEMSEMTRREMLDYRQGSEGTLRLGAISSVGSTLLSRWLAGFCKGHPHIHFEVFEANTYELLEQVRAGVLDLAIVRTPFSEKGLECVYLAEEAMMAVGRRELLPDSGGMPIRIEQLGGKPLIFYRRWEKVLAEAFGEAGVELTALCKNDDARTTAFWAAAGLGIGIVPASVLPLLDGQEMICRPIAAGRLSSRIAAVRDPKRYFSTIAAMFLAYLQEVNTQEASSCLGQEDQLDDVRREK